MQTSLEDRLYLASSYTKQMLQITAPKQSWNLALNGIRLVQLRPNYWRIVIGGEVAPYGVKVDKKNKTGKYKTDWVKNTLAECQAYIMSIMGGSITEEDIEKAMESNEAELDRQRNDQIQRIQNEINRRLNEEANNV